MVENGILKNFNGIEQCPGSYQIEGFCLSYFFKVFNEYPSVLHIEHKDYLQDISKFPDPILKYIALYLYHNYVIAKNYFNNESNHNNNDACAVLNRWLDQQKHSYTYFGTCTYNRRLWNIHIEPLWKELEGYFTDKKCDRFSSYYYNEAFPNLLDEKKYRHYQQMPEEYVCYKDYDKSRSQEENDDENSFEENCAKLSILFYLGEKYKLLGENSNTFSNAANEYCTEAPKKTEKIYYSSLLKAEKLCFCDSLKTSIALPISVTILGTIFLAFFLNEFTPIGSILETRSKNKVRLREHLIEEAAYEEYKTYRNNNQNTAREKNSIYYQSMNK